LITRGVFTNSKQLKKEENCNFRKQCVVGHPFLEKQVTKAKKITRDELDE